MFFDRTVEFLHTHAFAEIEGVIGFDEKGDGVVLVCGMTFISHSIFHYYSQATEGCYEVFSPLLHPVHWFWLDILGLLPLYSVKIVENKYWEHY